MRPLEKAYFSSGRITRNLRPKMLATDQGCLRVDRIWPRGIKKEAFQSDEWIKAVAPSLELRKWFGHDPEKWTEFQERYAAELEENSSAWQPILAAARQGKVTLLYAAKDEEQNNAVALQQYLERKLAQQFDD